MRISHEIPKQLFPVHDLINDYPYALAHLMMTGEYYDKEYTEFYAKKLTDSEFSILDNGCYELGYSIPYVQLWEIGEKYKPSHLVLPDIYRNCTETIDCVKNYLNTFPTSTPKFMAVLQGTTLDEYIRCYQFYVETGKIDIVGVNFKTIEGGQINRLKFLKLLFRSALPEIKIHLLGCENPGEFLAYDEWVKRRCHSIDTSSPIIHGWLGNRFDKHGVSKEKPIEKLAENLDIKLSNKQCEDIYYNVKLFKLMLFN